MESSWITGAGTRAHICLHVCRPSAPPRAIVVFLHGVGEHARRYDQLFAELCARGFLVHAPDFIGHGRSDGLPGYVPSFADAVEDARGVCEEARRDAPGVPLALCGQSFGGLVAATVAANDGASGRGLIDGLVLTAASIDVRWTAVLRAQAAVGAALALAAPRARWVPAVRLEDMSDDAATVESYASDPLVQIGGVRCRTAYEILRGFRSLRARYGDVRCALLALHGGDDACADKTASERLVREASSASKEYVELPRMHHLIMHEPGSEAVRARLADFVERLAASPPARPPPSLDRSPSASSSTRSRL